MNVISDLSTTINNFLDGFNWDKCVNTYRIDNPFIEILRQEIILAPMCLR